MRIILNLLVVSRLCAFEFEQPNNGWRDDSIKAHFENTHRISENSLLHFENGNILSSVKMVLLKRFLKG